MDPFTIGLIIGILAAGAALAFSTIIDWVNDNKNRNSKKAEIVKTKLSNGDYRIVSGIFDNYGRQQTSQAWDTSSLDSDLEEQFGSSNKITINL